MVRSSYSARRINISLRSVRGQSLVESVLIAPILVAIIYGVVFFADVLITRQQLLVAARYGTDLIVNTSMDDNSIRNEIKSFLCSQDVSGRRLDPNVLTDDRIRVVANRKRFNPVIIPFAFNQEASFVEITYEFELPALMRVGNNRGIIIKERSEVLAGTCVNNEGLSWWHVAELARQRL